MLFQAKGKEEVVMTDLEQAAIDLDTACRIARETATEGLALLRHRYKEQRAAVSSFYAVLKDVKRQWGIE